MPDIRLTALAATLLLSLPAAAAELTAKPVATPVPAERKICRTETRTGSNMPRRICHTRAEWDALARQNAEATARALDRRPVAGSSM